MRRSEEVGGKRWRRGEGVEDNEQEEKMEEAGEVRTKKQGEGRDWGGTIGMGEGQIR